MQPFDYSSQLQAPGVLDSYVQGLRVADAREQAALARQQKELEIQQKQAAMDAAAQKQQALQGFLAIKDPTGKDYSRLMTLFPEQAEHFQKAWSVLDADQKQAAWSKATQLQAALESGNTDIAKQLADQYAEAAKNAGDSNAAQGYQTISGMIDVSPEKARRFGGAYLMSIDADKGAKVIDQAQKLRLQASEQSEAAGKAQKAVAEGKYAEKQQLADLEQKGWNTKKLAAEIQNFKDQRAIELMKVQLSKEDNALKKQELGLKIQERQQKMADEQREKIASLQSGASNIDNMINTADRVLQNESLDSVLGAWQGRLPALASDEASNAIALIETLGSQAFLSQIPTMKGQGALSEKEGDKLQSALQNLSRVQSEGQFRTNLKEAQRIMMKARKNLELRYGVPAGAPDTPNVQTSGDEIAALLKKYGG